MRPCARPGSRSGFRSPEEATIDRVIVYPDALAADTDELNAGLFALQGQAYLLQAVLGTSTVVDGLACTPGTGLTVSIAPGSIYAQDATDATAYGSLGTSSAVIMKQGLSLAAQTLSVPAPTTSGDSIIYLVEAQYQDIDSSPATLSYYNSSNPSVPYSGPGNDGDPQDTIRRGVCALQVKAGTQAATGTETAPTADASWTPLWDVTVAYGASSIVTGDIAEASGAPFIAVKLPDVIAAPVPNSDLADMAATTVKANATGFSATPTDVTFASLLTALLGLSGGFSATYGSSGTVSLFSFMLQWATFTVGSMGSTTSVSWPATFPNACDAAWIGVNNAASEQLGTSSLSTTSVTVQTGSSDPDSRSGTVFGIGH